METSLAPIPFSEASIASNSVGTSRCRRDVCQQTLAAEPSTPNVQPCSPRRSVQHPTLVPAATPRSSSPYQSPEARSRGSVHTVSHPLDSVGSGAGMLVEGWMQHVPESEMETETALGERALAGATVTTRITDAPNSGSNNNGSSNQGLGMNGSNSPVLSPASLTPIKRASLKFPSKGGGAAGEGLHAEPWSRVSRLEVQPISCFVCGKRRRRQA